jgi:hypothetical protein
VLVGVATSPDAAPAARVAAAQSLLDRGWGKAAQVVDMTVRHSADQLSDNDLATIVVERPALEYDATDVEALQ